MKKPMSHKTEKLLLLWLPCLIILLAGAVLVPQLLHIISPAQDYLPIENIEQLVPVVADVELPEEVKTPQLIAPIEMIPVETESYPPASPYGWQEDEDGTRYYVLDDGSRAHGLRYIDDKLQYFDQNGRCAKSIGIDVSFYNGTVNWEAVRKSGIDFAVIRVGGRGWGSGGTLYKDSLYFNYLNGAKAAGLDVGVYFYSAATNEAEAIQEASLALSLLHKFDLELPVFFDTELSGNYPKGRADLIPMANRVEITNAFCRVIENAGYEAGIYASESFLTDELNYPAVKDRCIWMASYTENNALPYKVKDFDIWQLTDRGRITGVSGYCDINVMF